MVSKPRALFFGTPEFAVASLDALVEVADVLLVVTQPDRPVGRGQHLSAPPVKVRALALGLPVEQPQRLRDPAWLTRIAALKADVAVVVAYGKLLPKNLLELTRTGFLNVHASLLPRWRGAAPIAWAIRAGDAVTGITLMQIDEGLDTGPMLTKSTVTIDSRETTGELTQRLSIVGGKIIREHLDAYVVGQLQLTHQPLDGVTLAPRLEKKDGQIDWSQPTLAVHNHIRSMAPWPGAFTYLGESRLKIGRTHPLDDAPPSAEPGSVLGGMQQALLVATGSGKIAVAELQREGGRRMNAEEFLRGYPDVSGARFA